MVTPLLASHASTRVAPRRSRHRRSARNTPAQTSTSASAATAKGGAPARSADVAAPLPVASAMTRNAGHRGASRGVCRAHGVRKALPQHPGRTGAADACVTWRVAAAWPLPSAVVRTSSRGSLARVASIFSIVLGPTLLSRDCQHLRHCRDTTTAAGSTWTLADTAAHVRVRSCANTAAASRHSVHSRRISATPARDRSASDRCPRRSHT